MMERKQRLETLRDELVERIDRYRDHKEQRAGPLDKDMEEQAIELQNDEVVDALEREAEDELRQVMHALARIDGGEGELCEVCEEPIAGERLEALPFATLCRDCAEPR
ncbi:TraR/DksA family transcriptional regulator [Halomonas alkalicola]|uniref:TraR/DksA C4-type zinc finger protein n=1 Tax=Halomonas alkalicola TaxID=1930622 RepID=A0ABY9H7C7_9GAMM|nr:MULTISPECIES: TraR/DksA C4-type zinc finger protein [Halomonas]QJQ98466.1 TraR/DksA family transcriptional regulator [Halomonas sp. PGE1]WLI74303.1 TraR/DksA C4-type zinc finger protein [Halomonas alkalicola]